jgi:hypothetical protein
MSLETEKNEIIKTMDAAYETSGYHKAYEVFNTTQLTYPVNQADARVQEVEDNFVGTLKEINAERERVKAAYKETYHKDLVEYNRATTDIRDHLIDLAAKDALPTEVANNAEFVKATWYYALSKDEPYNWASEYSDFWDTFEAGMKALKGE